MLALAVCSKLLTKPRERGRKAHTLERPIVLELWPGSCSGRDSGFLEPGRALTANSKDHRQQAAGCVVLGHERVYSSQGLLGMPSSLESIMIGTCGVSRLISVATSCPFISGMW